MDAAIKAIWYDLADEDRDAHLAWLHEEHLPTQLSRPGILWAASYEAIASRTYTERRAYGMTDDAPPEVPRGQDYLVLLGAATPDVFFVPSDEPEPAELGARREAREAVLLEEMRVDGPERRRRVPGTTPAPVIQFGGYNTRVPHVDDVELATYYRHNRFPAVGETPGCVGARKFLSVAGFAKHSVLYEFTSVEARAEGFERRVEVGAHPDVAEEDNPYVWSGRQVTEYVMYQPGAPTVGVRLWP